MKTNEAAIMEVASVIENVVMDVESSLRTRYYTQCDFELDTV